MSRFLAWCVMFLCGCQLALNAQTVSGTCGKNGSTVKWELDQSKGLLLIGGEGEMQDFAPDDERWNGLSDRVYVVAIGKFVKSVGKNAFSGCTSLSKVIMGAGVEAIGDSAFCNCEQLKEFKVTAGVKEISETAFVFCPGLKAFTVDESNECFTVGSCGELIDKSRSCLITLPKVLSAIHTDYEVPSDVAEIGQAAFFCCNKLSSVKIHKDVKRIGESAFAGCVALSKIDLSSDNSSYTSVDGIIYNKEKTHLVVCPSNLAKKSVTIPETVTEVFDFAFSDCRNLVTVQLPLSVRRIGRNAFYCCKMLTTVNVPEGVERIEDCTFAGCMAMKKLKLPSSLKVIGNNAFESCTFLQAVEFPQNLTSVGSLAFYHCKELRNLEFPGSVTHIGDYCFFDCNKLDRLFIPAGVGEFKFFMLNLDEDKAKEEQYREWVRVLTKRANTPQVDDIKSYMLNNNFDCMLRNIEVEAGSDVYSSSDGMLFDKDKKTLLLCGGSRDEVRIPEGVEQIEDAAFAHVMTSHVYIPASVKSFGELSLPTIMFSEKRILHIYVSCTEVPEIGEKQIVMDKGTCLHVPKGCKQKYLDHPVWGKYFGKDSYGKIKDDIE